MSGIRTNAAAELLGVSPNTLRSWERRFGYPKPRRTAGGHRQYDLAELEALRRALLETHNISSAIEVARQRGEGPTSAARLRRRLRPLRRHARRPRHGGEPRRPLGRAHGGGGAAARARAGARPRRPRGRVRARLPLGDRLAARRPPRGSAGHPLRGRPALRLELARSTSSRCTCRRSSWRSAPRRLPHAAAVDDLPPERVVARDARARPDRVRVLRRRRHARGGRPARLRGAPGRLRQRRCSSTARRCR